MHPERWRRLNALFDAALARAPEARDAFVAEACGDDPTLRAELQSLLAAECGDGPLDETPPGLADLVAGPPDGDATPQLQAGQRLGPYEVVGLLGAGGMGEVYRARDPRLGREVAIKRVRAAAPGPEALRRFDQEARAAGALNHPNLLAVYDVGVAEGMPYVVTELLGGRTLRAELDAGRPPLRRALDLATQLARGLAAAHEAGIVHRDLKPENLFVTTDGRLKILDFGLAKTRGMMAAGASHLPTRVATEPGVLLGTVGYMAPEQVRSEEADGRADLFAAGVILHEMLAGTRAFHRGTAAETMAAILNDDPPPLPALPPPGGVALAQVVAHCLEKRPGDRYQSARDLAFDLEMVRGLSTAGSAMPAPAGRWRRVAGVVAAAVALAAAAAVVATLARRSPQPPTFHQLTFRRGVVTAARFTPGGDRVVYSAAWNGGPPRLYSVAVGGLDSQQLELSEAHLLAVSPRGELALLLRPQLAGWRFRGVLARAPLAGGAPRELLEDVEGADWAPDGETLAVVRWEGARARLEMPPGTSRFTADPGIALGSLRFSPDGSALAFIAYNRLERSGRLMVAERDAVPRALTGDWPAVVGTGLAWTADGREVLLAGLRADGQRVLRAIGRDGHERVLATLPVDFRLWDHAAGRLLVDTLVARREAMVASQGSGGGERDFSWLDWSTVRVLSADGGTLLFAEDSGGVGNRAAGFLRHLDQPLPVKLGDGYPCDLSRDGRWALVRPPDATRLRLVPTGPGAARDLPVAAGAVARWGRFTSDGSAVLQRVTIGAESHLHLQPLDGGSSRLLATDIAPDLLWVVTPGDVVVYHSRSGQVLARDLADGRARPLVGVGPDEDIVGSTPNGEAIFLARRAGFVAAEIDRYDLRTGQRTLWRRLSPADAAGVLGVSPIVGRDGERYAYSFLRVLTDLHVASGWADLPAGR